jgi:hypothetical protein
MLAPGVVNDRSDGVQPGVMDVARLLPVIQGLHIDSCTGGVEEVFAIALPSRSRKIPWRLCYAVGASNVDP